MTIIDLTAQHIVSLNNRIDKLTRQRDELLTMFRTECPHLKVSETGYVPMDFFPSLPPKRICEVCGIEEDGWNCGYKILVNDPSRIIRLISSRNDFYKLRQPGPECKVGNSIP